MIKKSSNDYAKRKRREGRIELRKRKQGNLYHQGRGGKGQQQEMYSLERNKIYRYEMIEPMKNINLKIWRITKLVVGATNLMTQILKTKTKKHQTANFLLTLVKSPRTL